MAAVNRRKKKSISYVVYVLYVLLLLILIGDIIGSSLYLKLDQSSQNILVNYVNDNISFFDSEQWSFNQIFYKQFMYQGSIWVLGLSIIGVIVNLFLIFLKGVIAGFNVFFIFETLPVFPAILTCLLWLIQYVLILGVTLLSGYFSIRFVLLTIKLIFFKKNSTMVKKHLLYYFYQLVIIMFLTLVTSAVTYLIQPLIYHQFDSTAKTEQISQVDNYLVQKDVDFEIVML